MTISDMHNGRARVQVWDIAVRLFHWSMVASVVLAYALAEVRVLHRRLGYVLVALIGFRLIFGQSEKSPACKHAGGVVP